MSSYLIQTDRGLIQLESTSFEGAQSTCEALGYTLTQPKVDLVPEPKRDKAGTLVDTNCNLCEKSATKTLNTFGRIIPYCAEHYEFEAKKLDRQGIENAKRDTNLVEKIEVRVKKVLDFSIEKASELYNTERPNWILSNFNSHEEMRDSLIQFITSLENLVFEKKNKLRAAYDAARELDANLSKAERDALVNDPSFKAPENKQFKKQIQKGTREEKAIASLIALGFTEEQAKTMAKKG